MYQLPCKYLIYITFLRFRSKLKKRRNFIFIGHATRGIHRALKRLYSKNMLNMLKINFDKIYKKRKENIKQSATHSIDQRGIDPLIQ